MGTDKDWAGKDRACLPQEHLDSGLVSISLAYIVLSKLSFICVFSPGAIWLQTDSGRGQKGSDSGLLRALGLCAVPGAMCSAAPWCPSRKALILLKESSYKTGNASGAQQEIKRCSPNTAPRKLPPVKCYRRHATWCQARGPEKIAGLGQWV